MQSLVLLSLAAFGAALTPAASSTTSAPTNIPSPGGPCTGDAYCLGSTSPIILRCEGGIAQPGNCDDNLNEPPYGAVCISNAPQQAYCSAYPGPSSASSSASTTSSLPQPGQTCAPGTSYCAEDASPIILRCGGNGALQPGNCDDNTGEPASGAQCVAYASNQAYCSIIGSGSNPYGNNSTSTSSTPSIGPIKTGTTIPVQPTSGNGTISTSYKPTAPTSTGGSGGNGGSGGATSTKGGSGPIQTGAAATYGVEALGLVAAAVLGAAALL